MSPRMTHRSAAFFQKDLQNKKASPCKTASKKRAVQKEKTKLVSLTIDLQPEESPDKGNLGTIEAAETHGDSLSELLQKQRAMVKSYQMKVCMLEARVQALELENSALKSSEIKFPL